MSSRTFIILKPDALERGLVDAVMQRFFNEGFVVEHMHYRVIDRVLIKKHYEKVIEREGPEFIHWLDKEFVGKPAIPIILTHENDDGITVARNILGNRRPESAEKGSIRGDYGIGQMDPAKPAMNLVHASDSEEAFDKEKNLWFRATRF